MSALKEGSRNSGAKDAVEQDREVFYRLNYPVIPSSYDKRQVKWEVPDLEYQPTDPDSDGDSPTLVITAIIDDGIPFAHANFRTADKTRTRVDFCWSQSATPVVEADEIEDGVGDTTTVLFGREFTSSKINALVNKFNGDEDAIYRYAGLLGTTDTPLKPLQRLHSHGAHVLDSLAGNWDTKSEAQCRIIAVDLPSSASWDTSGFGKDMFVLSAMHYVFQTR